MAIIGIDLGTSNSSAAVLRGGRPATIPSSEALREKKAGEEGAESSRRREGFESEALLPAPPILASSSDLPRLTCPLCVALLSTGEGGAIVGCSSRSLRSATPAERSFGEFLRRSRRATNDRLSLVDRVTSREEAVKGDRGRAVELARMGEDG
jgi:molecular chaperone DnaK